MQLVLALTTHSLLFTYAYAAREEKAEPDGLLAAQVHMQLFSALTLPTRFSGGVCVGV